MESAEPATVVQQPYHLSILVLVVEIVAAAAAEATRYLVEKEERRDFVVTKKYRLRLD